jgi:hypothetical protein
MVNSHMARIFFITKMERLKDIPECNEETGFMLSYLYPKMP